jgi:hypothetical protein
MQLHDMIYEAKSRYFFPFIMEILITGSWSLWDQRNQYIFNHLDPKVNRCITRFKSYFSTSMYRAKPSLKEGMQSWLDTL